jgi:hypothetical protein
MLDYFEEWALLISESTCNHALLPSVGEWECCVPALQTGEFAMITAEKCRIRATECKIFASSIDIPSQRSLEQSIMALNWEALADQIDDDDSHARLEALFAGLFQRPLAA